MKWTNELLDAHQCMMDSPADSVVKQFVGSLPPEKAREVFTVLIRNIGLSFEGAPAFVKEFMDSHSQLPAWVDLERVKKGQQVFADHGLEFAMLLFYKSLPTCYLGWQGCETLAYTGRLNKAQGHGGYARRISETTQFLFDVMTPGGFEPGGKAIETTLKVRLIHACIRYFVRRDPEFDVAKLSEPINQEFLAYTLQTFSLTLVQGLKQLKERVDEKDAEDFYYAWKVVGHFLGIVPEMVPDDLADSAAQQQAMWKRLVGSSQANKELTQALIDFAEETAPLLDTLGKSHTVLVRYFMGDEHARVLGVTKKKGCLGWVWPTFLQKLFGTVETLEEDRPKREAFLNNVSRAILKGQLKKFRSIKGSSLIIRDDLKTAWGLD